ncbi:MAG: hypothetical protein KKA19_03695, partial [Candidatus Margulisbacteria bacterium]|nr:hypothetical protein [Candidatus Margulisiibacteriota bacterium]
MNIYHFIFYGKIVDGHDLSAYAENYECKLIDAVARAAMASSDESVRSASAPTFAVAIIMTKTIILNWLRAGRDLQLCKVVTYCQPKY